jgi:hypothetical protein
MLIGYCSPEGKMPLVQRHYNITLSISVFLFLPEIKLSLATSHSGLPVPDLANFPFGPKHNIIQKFESFLNYK